MNEIMNFYKDEANLGPELDTVYVPGFNTFYFLIMKTRVILLLDHL